MSKAARGYHLALGVSPAPEKAKPVHLTPEMTVHEAFVVTARSCIEHIVANVDSAHDGKDPEGIHQLRVGIRRLRAALSIFKAAVPAGGRNALGGELRWLQQELGPAREWDVFINETLSRVVRHCGGADFSPLVGAAEAKRAEAYARARSVLGDRRYTDLLLRLEAWLESGLREGDTEGNPRESRHEDVGVAPAPGFASEILRMRQAKVQKHGRKIRSLGDEGIHDLRIRVKKLRYATEFFRGLYGEKPTKRYLARLKDLQDILGNVHDVFVAQALVPQLAGMVGEGVPLALGQVQGWCAARRQGDLGRLVSAWKAFSSLKPFWKDHAP
ncbi:MAG TPA: CHAD domain-containing protein [Alphaproteobacteria bacterium]|nr:CHAD domain-containing protein [Alphaproteobacteria bacterium]